MTLAIDALVFAAGGFGRVFRTPKSVPASSYRCFPSLVIVGDADHDDKYSRGLISLASRNVQFLGRLSHDETLSLVRGAGVFILPSFHEGLPIVLLEALALGTLVLASDIIPNKEILGESEFGYLFETGNARDLSKKLEEVLSLGETRKEQLRSAGKHRVEEKYDWRVTAARFAAIAKQYLEK